MLLLHHKGLYLAITKRTDSRLLVRMKFHYSQPKGFVGRSICYAIYYNATYYGHICGGSATRFLPGCNAFLGVNLLHLSQVVNNIFYNVSPADGKYPSRNFTSRVVKLFMRRVQMDWYFKYGDQVVGFETLVEKPRTGDLYLKAGWTHVGETAGFTCKRTKGKGTDSWSGKRVWNTDPLQLKPKLVLCCRIGK